MPLCRSYVESLEGWAARGIPDDQSTHYFIVHTLLLELWAAHEEWRRTALELAGLDPDEPGAPS